MAFVLCLEFLSITTGNVSTSSKESHLMFFWISDLITVMNMSEKMMLFYCNNVWLQNLLGSPQGV